MYEIFLNRLHPVKMASTFALPEMFFAKLWLYLHYRLSEQIVYLEKKSVKIENTSD